MESRQFILAIKRRHPCDANRRSDSLTKQLQRTRQAAPLICDVSRTLALQREHSMRLCSYIVKNDAGLAPNPFYGCCTLSVCTPNHMGVRLEQGDWILGTGAQDIAGRIVYAMQVSERLHFDDYFQNRRYQSKKPDLKGNWKRRCGDNMYYLGKNGKWRQLPVLRHDSPEARVKDTKHPYSYVATLYYYFGEAAPPVPSQFAQLVWQRQGCKCSHPEETVREFTEWLSDSFRPGQHGLPKDRHIFQDAIKAATCSGTKRRTADYYRGPIRRRKRSKPC